MMKLTDRKPLLPPLLAALFLFLSFAAACAAAEKEEDVQARLEKGEIILTPTVEDGADGAEAVAIIDAPIDDVWDVIIDLEIEPKWMYGIAETEILSGDPKKGSAELRGILKVLLFSFTYFLHYDFEKLEDGTRIKKWRKADPPEGMKASFDYRVNGGSMIVKPTEDGKRTLITYRQFIDPGAGMPETLKKKLTPILVNKNIPTSLKGLREYLKKREK